MMSDRTGELEDYEDIVHRTFYTMGLWVHSSPVIKILLAVFH